MFLHDDEILVEAEVPIPRKLNFIGGKWFGCKYIGGGLILSIVLEHRTTQRATIG